MQLATLWLNEEWYNDKVQLLLDPNWVCLESTETIAY